MNGKSQPRRGHMLLVAIVLTTLISIALAMALQPAATVAERTKERELLYRGQHMAEGIKRYYLRHGRFPFRLEELTDGDVKYVRRLYADPMTEDGEWTLVYLAPTDLNRLRRLNTVSQRLLTGQVDEVNSENQDERGISGGTRSVFRIETQQITGIRSKSDRQGFRVHQDSQIYSDWLFSALPQQGLSLRDLAEGKGNTSRQ